MTKTNNILEELEDINKNVINKLFNRYIEVLSQVTFSDFLNSRGISKEEIFQKIKDGEHKNNIKLQEMFKEHTIWGNAKRIIIVNNIPTILYPDLLQIQAKDINFNTNLASKYANILGDGQEKTIDIINIPINTEDLHINNLYYQEKKEKDKITKGVIEEILKIVNDLIGKKFTDTKGEDINKTFQAIENETLIIFNDYIIIADILEKIKEMEEKKLIKASKINISEILKDKKDEILPVLYAGYITEKGLFYKKLNDFILIR